MEVINGTKNYHQQHELAMALGNFDGVHLAHQKIITRTVAKAREKYLKSAVFMLHPHPLHVLFPEKKFYFLSTLEERIEILQGLGVDYLIVENFSQQTSQISPFRFVKEYLVEALNVREIVVGYDYTFGRKGRGTIKHLLNWCDLLGYGVEVVQPVMIGNQLVSSSFIRDLVRKGRVEEASHYLGYFFSRSGRVVYGEGLGRELGFPTANLQVSPELLLPGDGVYLALVCWKGNKYFGLTNIGKKPTFRRAEDSTFVEVFLFDFYGNLYGEELKISFLQKLRDEVAFLEPTELQRQIQKDAAWARELIHNRYCGMLEKESI